MSKNKDLFKKQFKKFYEQHFETIIEINEKYSTPRLEKSLLVKISLSALKFYLLFIIALFIYKFITIIKP